MVHCVICTAKIKGQQDEIVGRVFVLWASTWLRSVPSILYGLDEPGETFIRRAAPPESDCSGGTRHFRSATWVILAAIIRSASFARWLVKDMVRYPSTDP